MTEVPLGGGVMRDGVVLVGDTVRRPPSSQLVRDVLVHLERAGFDAAPPGGRTASRDRLLISTFPPSISRA